MTTETLNVAFNRERVKRISGEVQTIAKTKRDFLADRKHADVIWADGHLCLSLDVPQPSGELAHELFRVSHRAVGDLCGTLRVPMAFANRLHDAGHQDMVAYTMTELLHREPKRHLWRTVGGRLRAVLSDSYRCMDNFDLLVVALQEFQRLGVEVWDLRHDEDGSAFRVVGVHPSVSEALRDDVPGAHHVRRLDGAPDLVYPAIWIGNSETGGGKIKVQPGVIRRVCANGLVLSEGIGRVHLGRKQDKVGEVFYSEATKRLEDEVLLRKIRELIGGTMDPVAFRARIGALNDTTQRVIDKPTQAVEVAVAALGLPVEHKEAILENLLLSRDLTQFGLAQAITALGNPTQRGARTDADVTTLEEVGGSVLALDESQFRALVGAA